MKTDVIGDSENENSSFEVKAKVELLQAKVNDAIKKVRGGRRDNRKKASLIKLTATFFSATATVLLGLQVPNLESQFKDIAFVLTASITLLSALEPFFNFRALWVEHEIALWKFYRLRDKLDFFLAGNRPEKIDMNEINKFHAEFQSIWDDLSQSWINYRKQDKS
ncbi:MAG: SLATT domain-containing protein [Leptolyngbyaceae cyanobacterium]